MPEICQFLEHKREIMSVCLKAVGRYTLDRGNIRENDRDPGMSNQPEPRFKVTTEETCVTLIPVERTTGLILGDTGFKKILFFL